MSNASQVDPFESVFAKSTAGFFLREFCFSVAKFKQPSGSEVELADFVIHLDDIFMVFQVKNRTQPTADPDAERVWFERKVRRNAKSQIGDTLKFLRDCPPEILNDRGRRVAMPRGLDPASIIKIVVFNGSPDLPVECVQARFYESKTSGFIHLISGADWKNALNTLVTPREIADYLKVRETLCRAHPLHARSVSEKALVGQYIKEASAVEPSAHFEGVVDGLVDERDSFDVLRLMNLFGDRVTSELPAGVQMPVPNAAEADHYAILAEIAKLPRNDLVYFKERFELGWEWAGSTRVRQAMRFEASTGVGFVFAAVPAGFEAHAVRGLNNFTRGHKYERRLTRAVGVCFIKEGDFRFIWWTLLDWPWEHDSEMDTWLREHPLSEVEPRMVPRYLIADGE